MGTPMATRLLQAGYQLTVWNRTPERGKPLEAAGATVARSPAEAGAGSNAGRPTWIIRRWWQQSLERSQSPSSVILYTRPGARRPAGGSGPRAHVAALDADCRFWTRGHSGYGRPAWWAHLVGALRVHPHKHCANYPPQKDRGATASGRILHRSARGQCLESPTREHSMALLTVVPRGLRLPLARQGLTRFPHSRSSTSRSGPRVHQANTVPNL